MQEGLEGIKKGVGGGDPCMPKKGAKRGVGGNMEEEGWGGRGATPENMPKVLDSLVAVRAGPVHERNMSMNPKRQGSQPEPKPQDFPTKAPGEVSRRGEGGRKAPGEVAGMFSMRTMQMSRIMTKPRGHMSEMSPPNSLEGRQGERGEVQGILDSGPLDNVSIHLEGGTRQPMEDHPKPPSRKGGGHEGPKGVEGREVNHPVIEPKCLSHPCSSRPW